jgi:hypothetical protein
LARVQLPEPAVVEVTFMVAWPLPFSPDPDAFHHNSLNGLITLGDLGGTHELKFHRPHLGRHSPFVHRRLHR